MDQLSQRNETRREQRESAAQGQNPAKCGSTAPCLAGAIHSEQIFTGRQRVTIVHAGGLYQLQQTRHGKLILTK